MDNKTIAFSSFDTQCTTFIKGIAIILMVVHHLWGFNDVKDFSGFWSNIGPLMIALGKAGKICVAIFAFISGYGIYCSYSKHNKYSTLLKKVEKTFVMFWKIAIPFLITLFILPIIPFNIVDFVKNLFCISCSYNGTWWYLNTYIIYIIIFPIVFYALKNKLLTIILCLISIPICRYLSYIVLENGYNIYFYYFLYYLPIFVIGSIFARFNLLNKLTLNGQIRPNKTLFLYIFITFALIILRLITGITEILFILTPCFMLCFIQKPIPMNRFVKVVLYIGKMSMGIWIIHYFFIEQIPVRAITNNCVLQFIFVFGCSLLYVISIKYIYKLINNSILSKTSIKH